MTVNNQWVLVPEILRAIDAGHNTPTLLLKYFPHDELRTYCRRNQRPYWLMHHLVRDLRAAGAIEYDIRTRKWKTIQSS